MPIGSRADLALANELASSTLAHEVAGSSDMVYEVVLQKARGVLLFIGYMMMLCCCNDVIAVIAVVFVTGFRIIVIVISIDHAVIAIVILLLFFVIVKVLLSFIHSFFYCSWFSLCV